MNKNLLFEFTIDKENKFIYIKREFDAALPLIWNAFTKSEMLDQWWAPKPWKAKTKTMDFKPGGYWLYAMVGPNNEEHWSTLNYSFVKDQNKFIGQTAFTDEEGNINKEMPQSTWEVNFTTKGDATLVEFMISYNELSHLEKIIEMGFKGGITMTMNHLDEILPSLE